MESLRMLQRQRLQQLLRARPLQSRLFHLQPRIQTPLRNTYSQVKPQTRLLHTQPRVLYSNSRSLANPFRRALRGYATSIEAPTQHLSLSQRLKKLSREYGWAALGVYLLLSALDFPFCFLAVRLLGTDRIGHWEHVVISTVKEWVKWPFDDQAKDVIDGAVHEVDREVQMRIPVEDVADHGGQRLLEEDQTYVVVDHGYHEAKAANKGSNASIWTQLALAYAIHKSFIFLRVPLTAAVTPKVVKTLRSWGWNIGKMPAKKVTSGGTSTGTAGVNTKGSGIKSEPK